MVNVEMKRNTLVILLKHLMEGGKPGRVCRLLVAILLPLLVGVSLVVIK